MFSDHLAGLNPEQLRAVTLGAGSALVLAGAGSGKTRVLTTRIAWLIANQRAMAANIMAVTFTNKAAREMHTRLSAMLPLNPRGMWIGTFHGLANRFLRAHWRDAGPREAALTANARPAGPAPTTARRFLLTAGTIGILVSWQARGLTRQEVTFPTKI